jgi:hypothetical protein
VDHGERIAEMLSEPNRPRRWIIPAKLKPSVIDYLDMMNINAMSLHYEGADSVGRRITESLMTSKS